MTLTRWQLIRVAFRSFFLQASWNYRGMMSMGFLYAIAPGLDVIYKNNPDREQAYMRHFEYFNTNPYFSSIVLGATLSLEEKLHDGDKSVTPELIHTAKDNLMTSLAAIGDGLFWDSWRPFVAALSLVFAASNLWTTPFVFFILYNIPHLYLRFAGVFWGYEEGMGVARKLRKFQFPLIRDTLRMGTLTLLAYLVANHINIHTPFLIGIDIMYLYLMGEKVVQGLVSFGLVALGVWAIRHKVNVFLISFLLLIFALVFYHWGILI